jgi:WXG100 family type VII secretion target
MAYTVQADDEQLNGIGQRFDDQSSQVQATLGKVQAQMQVLKNGAWQGPNAEKFYQIMEQEWIPSLGRASKALEEAANITRQVQNKSYFPT